MTGPQQLLAAIPRPADALDCGVVRDRAGMWAVAWIREGRLPEPMAPAFASVRTACDASQWLRQQHGLDR